LPGLALDYYPLSYVSFLAGMSGVWLPPPTPTDLGILGSASAVLQGPSLASNHVAGTFPYAGYQGPRTRAEVSKPLKTGVGIGASLLLPTTV
jgi:hypothetical protein